MTKTLAEIKAESGRDLDEGLAETTLVPGEGANFGAFKLGALWTWIKSKFANVVEANNMNAVTSNAVNTAVTAITAKIPDSATSSNKLATESEITGINAKIPSDATSENKLVSTTQLNGSLADYAKTEALTDYQKKELSFFEILSRPNKYIGNYNVNNKFSGWVAPYDCIVVCEIAKNNNEGSQNAYVYVDSIQVDAFIGLNFPYTNSTFYIPMKKNQKLTFLLDGEWAYHQAYIYFH